jgi:hypothetical protein
VPPNSNGDDNPTAERPEEPSVDNGRETDEQFNLSAIPSGLTNPSGLERPSSEIDSAGNTEGTVIDLVKARQRLLLLTAARRLAGQQWTAQAIAEQLNIPIEIARIAVLNPVGDNIRVPEPNFPPATDGLLYAGAWSESTDGIEIFCDGLCKVVVFGVVVGAHLVREAAEALVDFILEARTKSSDDKDADPNLDKKARDIIPNSLKRVKDYPTELEEKTKREILDLANKEDEIGRKAKKLKKLIQQTERLKDKARSGQKGNKRKRGR